MFTFERGFNIMIYMIKWIDLHIQHNREKVLLTLFLTKHDKKGGPYWATKLFWDVLAGKQTSVLNAIFLFPYLHCTVAFSNK